MAEMNHIQQKKKRYIHFMAALIIALSLAMLPLCSYEALARTESGNDITTIRPIGDINAVPPEITAKGAALYSLQLDQFVYTKNEDEKIDPYSITKALTCYLALENLDLDQVVTASEQSAQVYENGTSIFLKAGEKMTVRDLLYGAMLESGNDAAYALGEAVSGSEKAFAKLMNNTVKEWGCNDTHFVNANGWKSQSHYTTAHDMAIIVKHCMSNKTLMDISITPEYTIPETNLSPARTCINFMQKTIGDADNITFGKTGTWDEDDCSIILGFDKDSLQETIVLLGDTKKQRAKDALKLMDFAKAVTPGFMVSDEGDVVDTVKVRHGEFTKVDLAVDAKTVAYPQSISAKDIKVEINADHLEAPLTKGDKAGTYTVYVEGNKVAEHNLIVTEDIATGWFPSYWYISNAQTITILKIAGAVMLILILFIIVIRRGRKRRKRRNARERGKHDIGN